MASDALESVTTVPLVCADLELSDPALPPRSPSAGLALLVRIHGEPIGDFDIDAEEADAGLDAVVGMARERFAEEVSAHLAADGLPADARPPIPELDSRCRRQLVPPPGALSATVLICTLGKHPLLPAALRSILAQDFEGDLEILVVDNAPTTGLTRKVLDELGEPSIRYAEQPVPGLANARNAGVEAATGDVILFTDDDVIADPGWVRSLVEVFTESPEVDAVTGLVVPGSLKSTAEQMFEAACGFNKGYTRHVWTNQPPGVAIYQLGPAGRGGPLFPFAAGRFGSGNNMAWRRSSIRRIGGFDPAMWVSEDIDAFFRLVFGSGVLVYEPRGVVRHFHRDTYEALQKQMENYGVGFISFLTKQSLHTRGAAKALLRTVPKVFAALASGKRSTAENEDAVTGRSMPEGYPRELVRIELLGMAKGPYRYLRDRHRIKSAARTRAV